MIQRSKKTMTTFTQPFDCLSWPFNWLMVMATTLVWPLQSAFSGLISLFLPTTYELNKPHILLFRRLILLPVYLALVVIFAPLGLSCIPLRCLLSLLRHPFQYSVIKTAYTSAWESHVLSSLEGSQYKSYQFGVATANVCLLPEFLARINNISHGSTRARTTGERIVVDQFFYAAEQNAVFGLSGLNDDHSKKVQVHNTFAAGLDAHFPQLDFLCLQEVFDWNYNKILRKELHKVWMVTELITSLNANVDFDSFDIVTRVLFYFLDSGR